MTIKLDDTWTIKSDEMCWTLYMTQRPEKGKNAGKEVMKPAGYYGTLLQAVQGVLSKTIEKDNTYFVCSLQRLETTLKQLQSDLIEKVSKAIASGGD
jgi:hypothetical protein